MDRHDRAVSDDAVAGKVEEHKDVDVAGDRYRLATVSLGGGRGAVQVAQQFSDTEDLLRELQQRTVLLVGAVVIAAGLFGWWLARRITRRLVRLAGAAEDVARTGHLGIQVPVTGYDEVGRLRGAPSTGCSAAWPSPRRTSAAWSRTRATSCVRR